MRKAVINNCVLYQGDCFEIMADISGTDLMITDPPYGCTNNDWDCAIDLPRFWELTHAATKEIAPYCLFCQMPFAARLYNSNPENFRYEWIYKKPVLTGFLDARKKPLRAHESIYIFCKARPPYNPQMSQGAPYKKTFNGNFGSNYGKFSRHGTFSHEGNRFPTTILDVKHESVFYTTQPQYPRHPTQKSVAAVSFLVKTYTNPGDVVLDPFMGSGSTGVAAVQNGRKFIGIEQDQKWFEVAIKRIEDAYQRRGLLEIAEAVNE